MASKSLSFRAGIEIVFGAFLLISFAMGAYEESDLFWSYCLGVVCTGLVAISPILRTKIAMKSFMTGTLTTTIFRVFLIGASSDNIARALGYGIGVGLMLSFVALMWIDAYKKIKNM